MLRRIVQNLVDTNYIVKNKLHSLSNYNNIIQYFFFLNFKHIKNQCFIEIFLRITNLLTVKNY